ncbi:MAG: putative porin [Opitutus sp.]|nr:putative porin [Opitutus sp.]MCS6247545.1 putative porin [Opitutus sp.]MCS6274473.1 putative porin [Opitutus sp.]MCS6277642.1 putative porin [Opitutus sp.]MCS6300760.1 putative porin [Opitutus sp.]
MAQTSLKTLALLGSLAIGSASVALAQDSGPIIDKLVAKGLLTDQEGEDLRAEMLRDFGTTSPGKLAISSSVTKLKISGDARVRYQFDNEQAYPEGAAGDKDRNRYRYRVRLGLEAELGPKWTAATRLETASSATSTNADLGGNSTVANSGAATTSNADNFDKNGDTVFFGQAYLNYKDTGVLDSDSIDVRVGKLPHKFFNPGVNGFWIDSDINFEGAAEEIVYSEIGLKDSKLSTRAGQFILNNNAANAGVTSGATTNTTVKPSLLLMGQVEYATKKWKVAPTIVAFAAPAEHDKSTAGAAAQVSDTGVYNDLATVLVPFEYKLNLGAKPLALYATYGYNFSGEQRAKRLANSSTVEKDAMIYNAGVRYGENKLAGDYQLVAEYRHIGNGSYSSLLLDSDFNGGFLNGEGVILSGSYSFTSAVWATVTYFNSFNIESNRAAGGSTNRGNGFGAAQVLQVDLSAKF